MKKYFIVALAVLLTMGLSASVMAQIGAGISGSAHDLRGKLGANDSVEICVVCHTPHNSMAGLDLIWNHDETANTTFTMYSSSSIDGIPDIAGEPTGISKLCLGCHDGSTSVDAYGDIAAPATDIGTFGTPPGSFTIGSGGDLSTTHPISISYPDGTAGAGDDPEILVRTNDFSSASGTTGAISTVLEGGILQCSSCHDVHNGPETVEVSLLRGDMGGSALCLVCHDK